MCLVAIDGNIIFRFCKYYPLTCQPSQTSSLLCLPRNTKLTSLWSVSCVKKPDVLNMVLLCPGLQTCSPSGICSKVVYFWVSSRPVDSKQVPTACALPLNCPPFCVAEGPLFAPAISKKFVEIIHMNFWSYNPVMNIVWHSCCMLSVQNVILDSLINKEIKKSLTWKDNYVKTSTSM
jgi:hypothetical protein